MPELESQEGMMRRAKLASKIIAIGEVIGQVNPEGHNKHSNYDFVGYEQVNAILRTYLPKYKLSIIPEIYDIIETAYSGVNSLGKPTTTIRTIVKGSMMIVDTETGYSIERKFVGADQDTGGKSAGQAVTEMLKRFELKLFHISTKSDIDPDSRTNEHQEQPRQQPPQQRPPANKSQPQQDKFSERLMAEFNLDPDKVLIRFKEMKPESKDTISVNDLPGHTKAWISANLAKFQDCGLAQ
jgi:hypothetical protein